MKRPKIIKRIAKLLLISLASLFFVLILISIGAYPFLTAEEHIDSDILVVEGWQSEEALQESAELFLSGNYKMLITTGGRMISSNYLEQDHHLIFKPSSLIILPDNKNELVINVSGIDGASFEVRINGTKGSSSRVTGKPQDFTVVVPSSISSIEVITTNTRPIDKGVDNIFIKYMLLAGRDINTYPITISGEETIILEDTLTGELVPAILSYPFSIDYADEAKFQLTIRGISSDLVIAAPGDSIGAHRTKHNALGLQKKLKEEGFVGTPITLFTTGIHARRSRILYEQAVGQPIGLVVHKDPEFAPYTWWTDAGKWRKIVSELGGCIYYIWLGYEKNISHWIDKIGNNEGVP